MFGYLEFFDLANLSFLDMIDSQSILFFYGHAIELHTVLGIYLDWAYPLLLVVFFLLLCMARWVDHRYYQSHVGRLSRVFGGVMYILQYTARVGVHMLLCMLLLPVVFDAKLGIYTVIGLTSIESNNHLLLVIQKMFVLVIGLYGSK